MRHIALILLAFIAAPLAAQEAGAPKDMLEIHPSNDLNLTDFLWTSRPLVVFADNPADPRYVQQIELLSARAAELVERDVVVITDSDPTAESAVRQKLRPRGFMWVLIGKDGNVYLRKPFPWDVREITRSIDKMPLRQQEIRDRRALRDGS